MVEQLVINVGKKIRALRQQRGLSLRQLSKQIEVSSSAIHKIEQNLISPTLGTVLKIVKGLETYHSISPGRAKRDKRGHLPHRGEAAEHIRS